MIKAKSKDVIGPSEGEKWHLFLTNKSSTLPFQIENIGITYPNPKYYIYRKDPDLYVFEYILSGKGYLELNDKKITLEAGDLYIIEPHLEHAFYGDKNDPFKKVWVNFRAPWFKSVLDAYNLSGITVFKNTETINFFDELLLIAERSNNSDDISIDVGNVIFEIVSKIAKQVNIVKTSVSPLAQQVKNLLDDAFFDNITLEEISLKVHYSQKQINRVFKKEFNTTPYDYYLGQKINMAKRFLTLSNLSIKDIAEKLKFENQYYFSCLFKKKVGCSPLQYRNNKKRSI